VGERERKGHDADEVIILKLICKKQSRVMG
jgi:hypothetical protein